MRIGYMYDLEVYPPKGGNHVHALEITQRLIDAGHEVAVLDDPTMPRARNFSASTTSGLRDFCDFSDVLYIRIDARFLGKWPAVAQCMSLAAGRPIFWEINAPADEALAYSWLGGRQLDKPEGVLRRARRWLHAARQKPQIAREESLRYRLAKQVSGAICMSSALADYAVRDLGIRDMLVLPNGGPLISHEEIQLRRSRRTETDFTVLYSGSAMYPWQGLDFLTETIHIASLEAPDIRFVLAVNQRAESLPTSSNVVIREKLDQNAIHDAICAADVCVALPPEWPWSPYGFHGSPMKLFEYMACGSAVVTSNHGQMKDILTHKNNAMLCENTGQDILKQILWLKNNPARAKEIAENGWRLIQSDLNWKRNAERTAEFFQSKLTK